MMRVACLAFASLLVGCSFDATGNGSDSTSSGDAESSGSGESSGSEAGSGGSGSGTSDSGTATSTTDTDPTTGTGTDTDPTTGTDTDPSTTGVDTDPSTTGVDTDPSTTGVDTDPTATATGVDTDPTTTGVQECGEQPLEGPYAQCFDTDECTNADHCIPLQGSGGGIIDGHCTNFCEFDDQCPVPPGCDVQARCQSLQSLNGGSACLLDCTQSQECPIGMECISVQLGYDICM